MKAIAATIAIACATLYSTAAFACDEQCLKDAAEKKHKVEFPSYLSWDYCDDIRMDFMTSAVRSLENYKTKHLDLRYKGGMRNIANFIQQREDWLKECDEYLSYTGKNRIFEDEATTAKVFNAMNSVEKELTDLANGVVYSASINQAPDAVVKDKFDELLKTVEDHKTLMHLKGKYVFR